MILFPAGSRVLRRCSVFASVPLLAGALVALASTAAAIAQGLPTPLPPGTAYNRPTGQQYLVYVNGNNPLLLDQVRQIEPGAFVNVIDGRSVIQAGRFNAWENAQRRVDELAILGIGARVQESAAVSVPFASAPPATTSSYSSGPIGDLPPLPVSAAPSAVEFGQAPSPPPSSPSSAAPPSAAPPNVTQAPRASGYYVVVPAASQELQSIANQIVSLGAAANLVQTRTAPRGPHVAVGPYADRGIAQDWSNYLRGNGITGARVHRE
ncbi:MAG: hypothetical protein IGR92_03195 [Leptolyngbyaceae cyanobacterium T60_A2020_046]|nr:hypothetical protein [Leptolyngbyaceae cyanobacterium T60_A2020_046]